MLRNKKGQSTIEYVILVTAVIVVAITFLQDGGAFRMALERTFNSGINGMEDMANRLAGSRPIYNITSGTAN